MFILLFSTILRYKPAWLHEMVKKYYQHASSWDLFILTAFSSFFHFMFGGISGIHSAGGVPPQITNHAYTL